RKSKANAYNVVPVVAVGERPKSIPELMASPAPDGKASPTGLTNAPNGNDLTTRQNQRIKKRRVSRHHPAHWRFQADQGKTTKPPFWVFSGYFDTFSSAFAPKADMCSALGDVRFGLIVDIRPYREITSRRER